MGKLECEKQGKCFISCWGAEKQKEEFLVKESPGLGSGGAGGAVLWSQRWERGLRILVDGSCWRGWRAPSAWNVPGVVWRAPSAWNVPGVEGDAVSLPRGSERMEDAGEGGW